jgi:N-acyl-D-amino-acid deacylase
MKQLFLTCLAAVLISCQQSKTADFIIRNATVYDGSGAEPKIQDVAIAADTILTIGDLSSMKADTVYDATGLVLAPGFVDTHSHHDWQLSKNRDALSAVSQGITTIIVGQDGGSNSPLKDYFQLMTDSPAAINVASYTGHNTLRDIVMGKDFRRQATLKEIDSMILLMRADMDAGALGLSTGLEYDPGIYSADEEVRALAKALPEYGGRYISHMRSEDRYFWKALDEIITIGREAKVPVQISHFKLAMTNLWGKADLTIGLLETARSQGVDITADIYPYTYWASTMEVLFPSRNFKDLKEAEKILNEIAKPEGIFISHHDKDPALEGLSVKEIADKWKMTPAKALLELVGHSDIVAMSMDETDVTKLMQWQHTNICSDGASMGLHPRGFGAFTRVLKHYVREEKALSMQQAIYKMTSLSAQHMGILRRGLIKEGYYADLVLFDPKTVGDEATIKEPQKLSTGIKNVWINGVRVERGIYPGRVIRRGNN